MAQVSIKPNGPCVPSLLQHFHPYIVEEQLYRNRFFNFQVFLVNTFQMICMFVKDVFIYRRFVASSCNCWKICAYVMKICG